MPGSTAGADSSIGGAFSLGRLSGGEILPDRPLPEEDRRGAALASPDSSRLSESFSRSSASSLSAASSS